MYVSRIGDAQALSPVECSNYSRYAGSAASEHTYDQETDARTNRADREIADLCGPAWDQQLNELQRAGTCGKQDAARKQLESAQISRGQKAAGNKICGEMLVITISECVRAHVARHQRQDNDRLHGQPGAHTAEHQKLRHPIDSV